MNKTEATEFLGKQADDVNVIIRTESQEQEFLTNLEAETIEKKVKPIAGKIHSRYEDDIKTISGEEKPPGMKAYDWNKKLMKQYKEKAVTADDLTGKVKTLEQQVKDGKGDEALKIRNDELDKEVKKLESTAKETLARHTTELEQEKSTNKKARIKADLTYTLPGLKFIDKSLLDENVRTVFIDNAIREVSAIADYVEGKLVFKDTEKNLIRNKDDSSVMTPIQMMTSKLDGILDKGQNRKGAGSAPKKGKGKGKDPPDLGETYDVPSDVTSKRELTAYLRSKGYKTSDPRYDATLVEHKDLPL